MKKQLSILFCLIVVLINTLSLAQSEIYFGSISLISPDTVEAEIKYNNISNNSIAGVQFDIQNVELYSFYDGDLEVYGFTISHNAPIVIAYDLMGNSIPPSNSTLTKVKMKVVDQNINVCIDNAIVSDPTATAIPTIFGDCFSYDSLTNNASLEVINYTEKKLMKVVDLLGREKKPKPNIPFIYIYNDGSVERKIILK